MNFRGVLLIGFRLEDDDVEEEAGCTCWIDLFPNKQDVLEFSINDNKDLASL